MMKHIVSIAVMASALILTACADAGRDHGHDKAAAPAAHDSAAITVTDSFLRPPLPGRTTAMAGFVVENKTDQDDVLLSVSSPIAQSVEIHTIITEGDIKKMRRVEDGIIVPARGKATLKHGADHVMLFEAVMPEGQTHIPLVLKFKNQGAIEIQAAINDGGHGRHGGH